MSYATNHKQGASAMETTSAHPDTAYKKFIEVGTATVHPGDLVKISLGMYERAMPTPPFMVAIEPREGAPDLTTELLRLPEEDHDRLKLYVQSFSTTTCKVTVWTW
jgi:hypothetical protein